MNMLNGIEVLSITSYTLGDKIGCFVAFLFISLLAVVSCLAITSELIKSKFIRIAITSFVWFIIIMGGIKSAFITDTRTTYDVTIDESVSFIEFDKRYEVIKRENDIYTIIER